MLRQELTARVSPLLPKSIRTKFVPEEYAWNWFEMRKVASAKSRKGQVRLLIAPLNYGSQAVYWARAASTLPNVSAWNMIFSASVNHIIAESDFTVDSNVSRFSHLWSRRQRNKILKEFTHIIYEAESSILTNYYHGDLKAEIDDLLSHGVKVAMVTHGSDTRIPSKHVELEPFSPFKEPLDGLTEHFEKNTRRNHALLESIDVPKFASTPDLLNFVPEATWLPLLVNQAMWQGLSPVFLGSRTPVVTHIPSRSALKGTSFVREALQRLDSEGLVKYVEFTDIPNVKMPKMFEQADVVIDQLGMAAYGATSVEAMSAGRLAVAQVGDFVRGQIKQETGWDVPIVEANPDSIYTVVKDIALNPMKYQDRIDEGREFVRAVHSDDHVADVLRPFLLSR